MTDLLQTLIPIAIFLLTLGMWLGKRITAAHWASNSASPIRIEHRGLLYKVVRLDSSASWRDLDLHRPDFDQDLSGESQ